jgi:hypothetical protein
MLAGWHLLGGNIGFILIAYSTLGFVIAGVAAIAVGQKAKMMGRIQ